MEIKIGTKFLREFADFSLDIPFRTAECLHLTLIKAYSKKDFDTVAKLQVKLHAEMAVILETAIALLLSFSKWDQPGGIVKTLLTYKNWQIIEFLDYLLKSDNALEILCFPKKEDVIKHIDIDKDSEKYYNSEELLKLVNHLTKMYKAEIIRTAYNKVKHSGVVIRDISIFGKKDRFGHTKVYIPIYNSSENKIEKFMHFPVVEKKAINLADKYLNNIKELKEKMQDMSNFFAYFLEKNLLLPSKKMDPIIGEM